MAFVVVKICARILVDRVRRVTRGLIDNEQGGIRAGRGCVDQIFTLKQIGEKAREKKRKVYVVFIDMEKPYDRLNREGLWLSANEGKNSKILWWNEEVKATLERKNTDWKEVLDTRDEVAKQDV